jgi:hypothetical protein
MLRCVVSHSTGAERGRNAFGTVLTQTRTWFAGIVDCGWRVVVTVSPPEGGARARVYIEASGSE